MKKITIMFLISILLFLLNGCDSNVNSNDQLYDVLTIDSFDKAIESHKINFELLDSYEINFHTIRDDFVEDITVKYDAEHLIHLYRYDDILYGERYRNIYFYDAGIFWELRSEYKTMSSKTFEEISKINIFEDLFEEYKDNGLEINEEGVYSIEVKLDAYRESMWEVIGGPDNCWGSLCVNHLDEIYVTIDFHFDEQQGLFDVVYFTFFNKLINSSQIWTSEATIKDLDESLEGIITYIYTDDYPSILGENAYDTIIFGAEIYGISSYSLDYDCFKLIIEESGNYDFKAVSEIMDMFWIIYSEDFTSLHEVDFVSSDSDESITLYLETGTYYFAVRPVPINMYKNEGYHFIIDISN